MCPARPRRRRRLPAPRHAALAIALALVAGAREVRAGSPPAPGAGVDRLQPVRSLGQPPTVKPFGGAYHLVDRGRGQSAGAGGGAYVGLYKDLLHSAFGIGVAAEGYAAGREGGRDVERGVRVYADLRTFYLKAGVDRPFGDGRADLFFSFAAPFRRGGLLGRGSLLRADWWPRRDGVVALGVQLPLEPHMGRTRPRRTEVGLPPPPPPPPALEPEARVRDALLQAREAARWIGLLSSRFFDDTREDRLLSLERTREEVHEYGLALDRKTPLRPHGHDMARETEILHGQVARAFTLAAGGDASRGRALAGAARRALLEDVLCPYNRLFGQYKKPDSLHGLSVQARLRFALGPGLPAERHDAALAVFDAYVKLLDDTRAFLLEAAEGDSRRVFLPFQLVLRPEEHATQEQIDAIVERTLGSGFSGGNAALYMSGQQFQRELQRMIHETRDYLVLWLHDYDGVNAAGDVDAVGFQQAVEGFLSALTRAVRDFDRTGRLPVYMVLVDLYYYEKNRGHLLLDLIEDPLAAEPRFPRGAANREREQRAREALAELRRAVAESGRLQQEARRRGRGWLRRFVRVHVSVTNPSDLSFRTRRLVGYLPIAGDNAMRDHRKLAFRDVSEADPGRGEALYGGVAVGEQYATATWEDRAVLANGPALVTLKDAARRALRTHGFREDEIPWPLREAPPAADHAARVAELEAGGATAHALQVHNDVGFASKDASVVTAIQYTLMPPGSLIVVPDPIWTSMVWAGQLLGAALRGCHVYVIAPALDNAPSAGFAEMSRSREIFERFFEIQQILGPQVAARGGALRTGLYTRRSAINDLPAKLRDVAETYRRYPFLREEFPFPLEFWRRLEEAPERLEAEGYEPDATLPPDARERSPKLHRKTRFFVTRDAVRALVQDPRVTADVMELLRLGGKPTTVDPESLPIPDQHRFRPLQPLLDAWRDLPPPLAERSLAYLSVGSLNQDFRGLALDGEALYVTSGAWSLAALVDVFLLFGSTTWVESTAQFDELLPPYRYLQRRIGRWVRKAV